MVWGRFQRPCHRGHARRMSDEQPLEVGTLARDTKRNKVGRVMGHLGPYVQLRPPSGGCEWDAKPEDVQPISVSESLSARVAEANAWSRWGLS